jgi:ParB family transcriptional regulator, chromosome partitioning protein
MNMPLPKNRLGRGLASLMGEPTLSTPRLPAEGQQRVVPIDQVHASPLNPRKVFHEGDLEELANSLLQKGFVQPIITRADPAGGYEIVAGERRWRAAGKAGLHVVPIIVRELDDKEMMELAIIENVQRADLNPIEEAAGYNELIQRFQYTQEQLAETIGKSRSHLANTLRLLKLPEAVQTMMFEGRLTAGHARALVGREDAEVLALRIAEQGLSVRDVEALVQKLEKGGTGLPPPSRTRVKDTDTKAFEAEFSDALGLKVEIKRGSGESGLLVIKFGNFDQLDYIRNRVLGSGDGSGGA